MNRNSFIQKAGVLTLGLLTIPKLVWSKSPRIFSIPGDSGHVRHGLLTQHERCDQLPSWISHVQQDRFYANGHEPSDKDIISTVVKSRGIEANVLISDAEKMVYIGSDKKKLSNGLVSKGSEVELKFLNINRFNDLTESTPYTEDNVLLVLSGTVRLNGHKINHGEGTCEMPRNAFLEGLDDSWLCIVRKIN